MYIRKGKKESTDNLLGRENVLDVTEIKTRIFLKDWFTWGKNGTTIQHHHSHESHSEEADSTEKTES